MTKPIAGLRLLGRRALRRLGAYLAFVLQVRDQIRLQRAQDTLGSVIDGMDISRAVAHAAVLPADDGAGRARETPPVDVGPLVPVPCPLIDISAGADPVGLIVESREFEASERFFVQNPAISRSLVSARSQALIYALVRNLKPDNVIEIGTYQAGTSEAICRALLANGFGMLHTVEPNTTRIAMGILARWPAELRRHVRLYAMNSMTFYAKFAKSLAVRPLLVFVDGNHDNEYAAFDIQSAAGILQPSGFVVVDNMIQAGPYLAARDFLAAHPGWVECASADYHFEHAMPFDRRRCGIPGTELMVLRAPQGPVVAERPVAFPEIILGGRALHGVEVLPGETVCDGVLHVQCVVRGFASGRQPVEQQGVGSVAISAGQAGKPLRVATPVDLDATAFEHVRLEVWLSWTGEGPLPLRSPPTAY